VGLRNKAEVSEEERKKDQREGGCSSSGRRNSQASVGSWFVCGGSWKSFSFKRKENRCMRKKGERILVRREKVESAGTNKSPKEGKNSSGGGKDGYSH